MVAAVLLFGMYYPLLWLNDQVKQRHLLISRARCRTTGFSLTLSVEAGF